MKFLYIFVFTILLSTQVQAQFGYGLVVTNDIYHRYSNPSDNIASASAGSAILNLGLGPKIWIGGNDFSVSVEALANVGLLGLSTADYKGLGTLAFPVLAKLNFKGMSAMDKEGKMGFYVGGGLQYTRTEMFGLKEDFVDQGVERELFQTIIAQAGYGFGINGFGVGGFIRYGWNPDNDANVFTFGIEWNFNAPKLRNIKTPASDL